MMELLWLLLPIAAASGWLTARYTQQPQIKDNQKTAFYLSPDYFKGLNYLLNEQPDKAIDVFIKLIDVDSDTVETHLALGVLFRRRGEVNRAIRIHQDLMTRSTLTQSQRNLARFELARDYQRAGLLDRAEIFFQELVTSKTHGIPSLHQLLEIYQQEQDWEKAIQTAQQIEQISQNTMSPIIAQYHCELAEYHRQLGDSATTRKALQQALTVDPNCVRASLLEGQLALEQNQLEQAIVAFKRVEQQNPEYLTEIIEPLQTCYQQLSQLETFFHYLQDILKRYGGVTPMLVLSELIKQQSGEKQAADFLVNKLYQRPSIRGLNHLLDLALAKPKSITHEHLLLLKEMTTQLLKNRPVYKCSQCGFTAKKLHWQCPSCQQWNTHKPILGIEGE